jgi:hypothetical protein
MADKTMTVEQEAVSLLRLIRRGIKSGHIEDATLLDPVPEGATEAPTTTLSAKIDRTLGRAAGKEGVDNGR